MSTKLFNPSRRLPCRRLTRPTAGHSARDVGGSVDGASPARRDLVDDRGEIPLLAPVIATAFPSIAMLVLRFVEFV